MSSAGQAGFTATSTFTCRTSSSDSTLLRARRLAQISPSHSTKPRCLASDFLQSPAMTMKGMLWPLMRLAPSPTHLETVATVHATTLGTSSVAALEQAALTKGARGLAGQSGLGDCTVLPHHRLTCALPCSWQVYENLELSKPRKRTPPPAAPKVRFVGCYKFEDAFGPSRKYGGNSIGANVGQGVAHARANGKRFFALASGGESGHAFAIDEPATPPDASGKGAPCGIPCNDNPELSCGCMDGGCGLDAPDPGQDHIRR